MERRRNQQTDHSVETKIIDQEQYRKKMKYTDTELEEILNKLVASTRSPRGRFSATASYPELEKRLKSHTRRLTLIRTFSAAAAVALLCLIGMDSLFIYATGHDTNGFRPWQRHARSVFLMAAPSHSTIILHFLS